MSRPRKESPPAPPIVEETKYVPPKGRMPLSSPVDINEPLARLHWRQDAYKGMVVDFCIQLQVREDEESEWVAAFKVDTSHGEVHHHQYHRSGKAGRRTVVSEIPQQGWDFVDNAWDEWLERMLSEWESYRARWNRG